MILAKMWLECHWFAFCEKANEKPTEGFVSRHEWRGKLVVVLTSRTCCRS